MRFNTEYHHKNILKASLELKMSCHSHVLDVGCGDGTECKLISPYVNYVVGIDLNPIFRKLSKVANLEFLISDTFNLPFKESVFDIVFEKDVLHHIYNHKRALEEMKRTTKKGGQVIVVEMNKYNLISYLHRRQIKDHHHFTKKYLENLLTYYFGNIYWKSVESHAYPITNKYLLGLVHFIENILAKVPLVKNFLSYNIAICKMND